MNTMIEINDLTTGYKTKRRVVTVSEGLSAVLRADELTCILGPNGAGKSTLLRTLCAFQPALTGSVMLMGRDVNSYTQAELSKLISVVLTDNSSIKNLSAWDVVSMGRSPYTGFWGRLSVADREIVNECFRLVGIEWLKDRKLHTLSDGECQKVMIAKALAQQTPIIILDEPTAFLDYPSKIQMLLLLQRLAKTLHKTIFLSTHDLEHALQIADQLWLLDRQNGLTTGSPAVLSNDGSVEKYFNRPGIHYDRQNYTFRIDKAFEATTTDPRK